MHSRADSRCAGLDTHVLKFLGDLGYIVPTSTPGSKKQYQAAEKIFLEITDLMKRPAADLDLLVWRVYSRHQHLKSMLIKIVDRKRTIEHERNTTSHSLVRRCG